MFRLVRYFTIASLITFCLALVVVTYLSRNLAISDMIQIREQSNVDLARTYSNLLWSAHQDFITAAGDMTPDEIRASEGYAALDNTIRQNTVGLSVIKVKIFAPNGLTIYSTNPDEIGADKSGGAGFETALDGGVVSELIYRDTFNAFEDVMQDRNIVESYVAIRPANTNQIEGVIEIYDDVTPLMQMISVRQLRVAFGLFIAFAGIFMVLRYIVAYAAGIMREQSHEIQSQNVELAKINANLEQANQIALEATRLKSEFLSTMSHELRTPLNSIIGYSGIITAGIVGSADENVTAMVTKIQNSGEHLLNLINNVLDISKIEAGRMEIIESEVNIRQMLTDVESQIQILAQDKNLWFETDVAPGVPDVMLADVDRIKQILINLLSNSVKFTDEGSVNLTIKTQDEMLVLEVTDTGVGIPAHALDYIFDEFRQVDGSSTRVYQGTGLGLAIVRKFTEAMNGTVGVQSKLNQGTTFTVKLPLKVPVIAKIAV